MGLREFALRLRRQELTAEAVTRAYCERVRLCDSKIGAFVSVADDAVNAARAIDAALRAGTDLGPLMGVPVAIKEIFAVDGLPYGAGTSLDLADIRPPQGPFVDSLKQAGCIILGTTRTTEFAAATINQHTPAPWNPADETTRRVCGGSSHGSAAALRAGLCAFSVGSDTGGSVRLPAALCGVFGFKSTTGVWPTEGVFSLSPTLDSVGIFTRSADDAALVFAALGKAAPAEVPSPRGLRLGIPKTYFFDQIDEPARRAVDAALDKLRDAGVSLVEVEVPDIEAAMPMFGKLLFGEFVSVFGAARLKAGQSSIDPVPWARIQAGLEMDAEALAAAQQAHRSAAAEAQRMLSGVDALLTPTAPFVACPVTEVERLEATLAWNLRSGRLTRPINFFGQCATSIPIQAPGDLPVGLQVVCNARDDAKLLAISQAVESITGSRPQDSHNQGDHNGASDNGPGTLGDEGRRQALRLS
jgi:aspartyl-tRNA(Asn)/glutamyl-tRNA(Gln) amidotransferase subunit A